MISCDAVLIICADGPSRCADVQSRLRATGAFITVDTFLAMSANDGGAGTPTAAQLAAYHAVLVHSNNFYFRFADSVFADPVLLGDRLAAYHNQGGGVVVAGFANFAGYRLKGAYGTASNGYSLTEYTQGGGCVANWCPSNSLGDVLEPESPLMLGVGALSSTTAYFSTAPMLFGRAVVVARWRGDGQEPLILRGTRGNRTLVELNFYPPSSSAHPDLWNGDGALLLRNGLKYSRCMRCGKGTYADAGDGKGRACACTCPSHMGCACARVHLRL